MEIMRRFGGQLTPSLLFLFAGLVLIWSLACSKSSGANSSEVEPHAISSTPSTPVPLVIATPIATPVGAKPVSSPPARDEIIQTVARVFDKAVSWDDNHTPSYLVGDFNGDGSEDLAIVTRTDDRFLGEINNELANWSLEDPKEVPIPGTKAARQMFPPKPVKAQKTDLLVAIIHGVGPLGWRNREARQTFLLRNAVGANMAVQSSRQILSAAGNARMPPIRGDTITEKLGARAGIIFWTGAKYAWYSPVETSK